jgi:hypothetical protein
MIRTHDGVQIDIPPHIDQRLRRGDGKLLLALLGYVVLAVLSAIGIDDMLVAARVTNGFVAFIVPVASLAALAGVIGLFIAGLNRKHRFERELLDSYVRAGRWPD